MRSGAGQGGAISAARRNGLKVITDHSIAHPKFMEDTLSEEYSHFGMVSEIQAGDALWTVVLKDCDQADCLLVNSDFVKDTFLKHGYPADRIRVAYLGVRESFFHLKKDYEIQGPIKLIFTGNLDLRKGARVLFEALRKLRAQGMDIRLELIGGMTNGKVVLRDEDHAFFTSKPFVLPGGIAAVPRIGRPLCISDADRGFFSIGNGGGSRRLACNYNHPLRPASQR